MSNQDFSSRSKSRIFDFLRKFRLSSVLILAIIFVIIGGGAVASLVVIWQVGNTIVQNARNRVDQDMNTAWAVYDSELEKMGIIIQNISVYREILDGLEKGDINGNAHPNEMEALLQSVMNKYELDFLTLTDKDGVVVARAAPPYNRGDIRRTYPLVSRALAGETLSSTEILTKEDLATESSGLDRTAFMGIDDENKRHSPGEPITSGMAMMAATPVKDYRNNILGVLYTGKLLTRNNELVDGIKTIIYKSETYKDRDVGASTIFQGDVCIATNVRKNNKNRAFGTLVSPDVYHSVIENGNSWGGRSLYASSWYISRYDPVRNLNGEIIGVISVGVLEQKYLDTRNRVIRTFLLIMLVGSAFGIYYSRRISATVDKPLRRLTEATEELKYGNLSHRVRFRSFKELETVADHFNDMSSKLQSTIREKDSANEELQRVNKHYMEMLGFVTHELMHPLGILKGYLVMLLDGSLGSVSPKQERIMGVMLRNVNSIVTMTKKYLHLSKIERGEIEVAKKEFEFFDEIVFPIIQNEMNNINNSEMQLEIENGDQMKSAVMYADPTLMTIVFNNLLQNALKYGRTGGKITIGFTENDERFRLNVKNEGPGIPHDKLELIFDKFERLERDVRSGIKGTGLGLFNTRQIIEKHGGKMWVESVEGEYANFVFTIPKLTPDERDQISTENKGSNNTD